MALEAALEQQRRCLEDLQETSSSSLQESLAREETLDATLTEARGIITTLRQDLASETECRKAIEDQLEAQRAAHETSVVHCRQQVVNAAKDQVRAASDARYVKIRVVAKALVITPCSSFPDSSVRC